MSDKEPRRRKKRKDSQRKDDVRSEDQAFIPTRSESKDSDPETEEEPTLHIHEPSSFAKIIFVILFSGLVVSMSFIFISLHGTERKDIEIFDDHNSEEHIISIDNYDPSENSSSVEDHEDDIDSSRLNLETHDETENWSPSGLFSSNIMDMLPDIGNMMSFGSDKKDLVVDKVVESENMDHSEEMSEISSDNLQQESESEVNLDNLENDFSESEVIKEKYSEINVESATSSDIHSEVIPEIHETVEEHDENTIEYEEEILPILQTTVDYQTQEPTNNHDEKDLLSEHIMEVPPPTISPSMSVSDFFSEPISEEYSTTPDSFSSSISDFHKEEIESNMKENIFTPSEPEDDRSMYEKAAITNDVDYEIREDLDQLDKVLEKSPENVLRKCEELLKLHAESPRLYYVKAQALDKLAELQRSNKLLEDAISAYQKVLNLKSVPDDLYLLSGKQAANRMRFRGFMGKSVKLLTSMMDRFPQNIELKNLVAVGYLLIGQNKASKDMFIEVLKIAPHSGFAKVHLGFILKTDESKYEESIHLLSEGISSKEEGVIDGRFYFHLGDALHRVGKEYEALKVYDEAVSEGLFLSRYQRSLYNVKGLTGKPWWDPTKTSYAPYFKILERDWTLIRDEALSLINVENSVFLPEAEGLQDKGDWKQFELFARGRKIEKNCIRAPRTCSLISQMPDAAGCKRGQVKFSIMHPSTHVWAHTGPTNCRLRAHLGLIIPDGARIRVANETRYWKEGKIILFDDSFEHEVWHNGNSSRVVLIVDFWHPELTAYQKRSLTPI